MPKEPIPAVGIDLGTTFSAVARLDDAGRPVTVPNAEGDLTTPSVVLMDGSELVVGKEAVKAMVVEAQRVAIFAKRDMGNRFYRVRLDGRHYPPEVVQAAILRKLKRDAQHVVGPFRHCVVTVPAYFDEGRRKATQDAGYIAGLEVMDIINEPTAAALAYGLQQGFLDPKGSSSTRQRILVYDLGGGTFDVTVMEIQGNQFRVLATDGDVQLGGKDWDERLLNELATEFERRHGIDPRQDPRTAARLWRDCEDAKRTLTARQEATLLCELQGLSVRMKVSRQRFEELTHDLVERTRFTVRQTLRTAGLDWGAIDRVLLVGGSSRMPMIRRMLGELSGREPDTSVSLDEAVCQGAALHAGLILATHQGKPPQFQFQSVNSHSLGVVGTEAKTGSKRNVTLIPRNTPLPAKAGRIFKTQKDGQRSLVVQIVEGDSPSPEGCIPLGTCTIQGLPPNLPRGTPVTVSFRYAANGRLSLAVKIAGSDRVFQQDIERPNSLTKEHLDQWRGWLEKMMPS